jgi:hypothetical protein
MRRAERGNGKGLGGGRCRLCPQPQGPGDTRLDGGHLSLERLLLAENPLGPDDEPFTFAGKALIVVPTVDQPDVQLPFELGDGCRECGLGDLTGFGGPREVPLSCHRDEVLQLSEKDECSSPSK